MDKHAQRHITLLTGYLRVGKMSNACGMWIKVDQALALLNTINTPGDADGACVLCRTWQSIKDGELAQPAAAE